MHFVKQEILPTETTISPALQTASITSLIRYLTLRFTNTGYMKPDDKPQAVVCFDTSGSGKTTTVLIHSNYCLNFNRLEKLVKVLMLVESLSLRISVLFLVKRFQVVQRSIHLFLERQL